MSDPFEHTQPPAPHPAILDEGIREVTMFLWNAGFWTFSACEGGEGHCALGAREGAFIRLRVKPNSTTDQTRADVTRCLLEAGYRGFESSSIYSHPPNHHANVTPVGLVQVAFGFKVPVLPYTEEKIKQMLVDEQQREEKIQQAAIRRSERDKQKRREKSAAKRAEATPAST